MANTEKILSNDQGKNVSGGIIIDLNTNEYRLDKNEREYALKHGLTVDQMAYACSNHLSPYSRKAIFHSDEEPDDKVKAYK